MRCACCGIEPYALARRAHAVTGDREVSEGLPVVREITGYGTVANHAEDGARARSGDEVFGDPQAERHGHARGCRMINGRLQGARWVIGAAGPQAEWVVGDARWRFRPSLEQMRPRQGHACPLMNARQNSVFRSDRARVENGTRLPGWASLAALPARKGFSPLG